MSYHEEIVKALRDWMSVDAHYSIVHFAVECGLSKDKLFKMAASEEGVASGLKDALDYALSVQEWKVAEGAMNGTLDRNVALKLLETYAGWKAVQQGPTQVVNVQQNQIMPDVLAERVALIKAMRGRADGM
jgi:hypothetical protein